MPRSTNKVASRTRRKKILNLVLIAAETGISKKDFDNMLDFEKELSVIVARNEQGEIKTFPVVELVYHPEANLVEFLFSPAQISVEVEQKARALAEKVITKQRERAAATMNHFACFPSRRALRRTESELYLPGFHPGMLDSTDIPNDSQIDF